VGNRTEGGGYTARDIAHLLDLSIDRIRSFVREGLLHPARGRRGEYRFTLQDLVLLRTAKELQSRVPPRKLRRALRRLRQQLPRGRPLTGVRITLRGADVVVRDGTVAWEPESGQGLLAFEVAELASRVAPLARRAAAEARAGGDGLAAQDWFDLAADLEPCDPDQARDAYRRALELDPRHVDAHVNLGRLLHQAGQPAAAAIHYRQALEARPKDAIAAFNLGVALEDLGRLGDAVLAYEKSLSLDPHNADAHFNLSRIHEGAGRKAAALRHLAAYRRLIHEA
jgi:tetratricopeptide (TPR) repeat protein